MLKSEITKDKGLKISCDTMNEVDLSDFSKLIKIIDKHKIISASIDGVKGVLFLYLGR